MAVNGIEIKEGQTWETYCSSNVFIIKRTPSNSCVWICSDGYTRDNNGKFATGTNNTSPIDLKTLVSNDATNLPETAKINFGSKKSKPSDWAAVGAHLVATSTSYTPPKKPWVYTADTEPSVTPPTAPEMLQTAAKHMAERAKTYDTPEGERSMGKAVTAFNAITGHTLKESEGWLLMQILKSVRLFTRKEYHADSAEDNIAYSALMAEAKAKE